MEKRINARNVIPVIVFVLLAVALVVFLVYEPQGGDKIPDNDSITTQSGDTNTVETSNVVTDENTTAQTQESSSTVHTETTPEETETDETATDETVTDETATDEITTEETATGETVTGETVTEETVTEETVTDESVTDEPVSVETTEIETEIETVEHAHVYDSGTVIKQSTCIDRGTVKYVCTQCGDEQVSELDLVDHKYDDGVITTMPTVDKNGVKTYTCTVCHDSYDEPVDMLEAVYTITIKGIGNIRLTQDGKYSLEAPTKIGYEFVKWITEDGKEFPSEGVVTSDVKISPVFEISDTTTVEQLYDRALAGVDVIVITKDIVIDRTIYVPFRTVILSEGSVRLIRDEAFAGEMFVVGHDEKGYSSIIKNGVAKLTLGARDGSSKIIIDGNCEKTKVDVVGSAIFVTYGAKVEMYDGVAVSNNHKVGNKRNAEWTDRIGSSCTMGGAAVFIVDGVFDMYGGIMENNSVNITNVGNSDSGTNYISSSGGAIYNFGTFNMYGGEIKNSSAVRGGAIYTRKLVNIYAGVISDNKAYSEGGVICASESPYSEVFIGATGAAENTVVFKNNVASVQGGVFFGYHYSPFVVLGGATFDDNSAESGTGGVVFTSGPVVAYDAKFINNYAYESGGVVYQYYIDDDTSPHEVRLDGCYFEENEAGRGAVVFISAADGLKKGSYLTVEDCTFKSNRAVRRYNEAEDTYSYGIGGVLYLTRRAKADIVGGCLFDGNTADVDAGAIYLGTMSVLSISGEGNIFRNNVCDQYGGAIWAIGANTLSVDGCVFDSNKSGYFGGAISAKNVAEVNIANDTEIKNSIGKMGSALYFHTCKALTMDTVTVKDNDGATNGAIYIIGDGKYEMTKITATGNSANKGGAFYISGGTEVTINDSEITYNEAIASEATGSEGWGGAIYVRSSNILTLNNCTVSSNSAVLGGGIYATKGVTYTLNDGTTITNNEASTDGNDTYTEP